MCIYNYVCIYNIYVYFIYIYIYNIYIYIYVCVCVCVCVIEVSRPSDRLTKLKLVIAGEIFKSFFTHSYRINIVQGIVKHGDI